MTIPLQVDGNGYAVESSESAGLEIGPRGWSRALLGGRDSMRDNQESENGDNLLIAAEDAVAKVVGH